MHEYKIAVLSDIHGNIWALEAVLEDIKKRNIDRILNLGDCFNGPMEPKKVADTILDLEILSVRGNGDKKLAFDNYHDLNPTFQYMRDQLGQYPMDWLKELPMTLIYENEIFMCHGTPKDDHKYLLEEICKNKVALRDLSEIEEDLQSIEQPLILCGHSHIPRVVYLSDGRIVVNPGSVGLPAFDEDSPHYYKVESGCPHASYAVITRVVGHWQVELISIPYDWHQASEKAKELNRPDWAKWLKKGRV